MIINNLLLPSEVSFTKLHRCITFDHIYNLIRMKNTLLKNEDQEQIIRNSDNFQRAIIKGRPGKRTKKTLLVKDIIKTYFLINANDCKQGN